MEGIHRVVVPIDKSDASRVAADRAAQLAKLLNVDIALVLVSDSKQYIASAALEERFREENQRALEEFKQIVESRDVPVTAKLLEGMTAADEIIKFSNKNDLIVMASHNKKGFDRFILGSTSEAVLRHAPCAILIIKPHMETNQKPVETVENYNQ
jgi:nucleotide-binding universal stress UspA family protein